MNLSNFKSVPQLLDYFKDEKTCRDFIEQQRWGGNPTCPFCNSPKPYRTDRGFKCSDKKCHKKFTVTVGTVFENTKLPLRKWILAYYYMTSHKKGISSLQLARDLDIGIRHSWFVLHRIRAMMSNNGKVVPLTGMVEVDETYVGGKNKNRHKNKRKENTKGRSLVDKTPVVGIIQREGDVHMVVVPDTERKTIHKLVNERVEKGTTLLTDSYGSYNGLVNDFHHMMVKHNSVVGDYRTDRYFHTNNIEAVWNHFKRGLQGIYHNVSPKHLQRYCDEFSFRYNTRKHDDYDRFKMTLTHVGRTRITYNDLTGRKPKPPVVPSSTDDSVEKTE